MKLLVVTQSVDTQSPTLGFFHAWLTAFAPRFEEIHVICLAEGTHALPKNVHVHSLGKENGRVGKLVYAARFLKLAWELRRSYDAVFVHMNQEYVLLAADLWVLLRKPVYMWRNHYAGSLLTDIAALYCRKVFCTSKHSYTARYRRTMLMPVGIDLSLFQDADKSLREPRSVLFLARMSPSKRPDLVIDALATLAGRATLPFTATFVGSPLPEDEAYYQSLKEKAATYELSDRIAFLPGIPHHETAAMYGAHDIFVNASPSGMFDKTLFEAAAAGCLVVAASDDFKDAAGKSFHFANADELADRLDELLTLSADERLRAVHVLKALARAESLETLADRLALELGASR